MDIKVVKFGGSSLADAKQMQKVKNIIFADRSRRFVIPSAPGKRCKDDEKVTDMLYDCYELSAAGKDVDECFDAVKARYNEIISDLGLDFSLENEFAKIRAAFDIKAGRDYIASRGEYLNGLILSKYLGFEFIDAADVIFFKNDGSFDEERTAPVLTERLKRADYAVIPGFYGSMPNGTIITFSRGGSDITGSIVAKFAHASIYENWTDVSGFLMADPRIIDSPKAINSITYDELRELAYMGATVLHDEAIFPVRKAKIPIVIKNTNAPEDHGTMIVSEPPADDSSGIITGIAGKKGFVSINIEKDMMNQEVGFGRKVLTVFENHGISFEHLPSGIDTMSVIVREDAVGEKIYELIAELKEICSPDRITLEGSLALIAIVGRGMIKVKGTASRIFKAISESDINIRMIDQGSSEMNIIIGVASDDFEKATKAIYNELCR